MINVTVQKFVLACKIKGKKKHLQFRSETKDVLDTFHLGGGLYLKHHNDFWQKLA